MAGLMLRQPLWVSRETLRKTTITGSPILTDWVFALVADANLGPSVRDHPKYDQLSTLVDTV